MSMIYESQTLVHTMETRVGQYKELKEQLTKLKKEFDSMVYLVDDLQGNGLKEQLINGEALVTSWCNNEIKY